MVQTPDPLAVALTLALASPLPEASRESLACFLSSANKLAKVTLDHAATRREALSHFMLCRRLLVEALGLTPEDVAPSVTC